MIEHDGVVWRGIGTAEISEPGNGFLFSSVIVLLSVDLGSGSKPTIPDLASIVSLLRWAVPSTLNRGSISQACIRA